MKNSFLDIMRSRILLMIKGKNVERFLLRLYKHKINIISCKKLSDDYYQITINYADYDKLLKLNTIYEISIIKYLGLVKHQKHFFKFYHVLLMAIISMIVIVLLSHIIFKVEIITNDENMRKRLLKSLDQYEISNYHFIKSNRYLAHVKEELLTTYHNEIEWLEIERIGTRYLLRYEPRIIKEEEKPLPYRNIVARKNAVIQNVYAEAGQIVKNKYAYVKKGDIIISGHIYVQDDYKKTIAASGKVYGEVWYVTKVTYPFNYYEEKKTGRKKTVYSVKLFNNSIDLFDFHPFNDKIVDEVVLLKNNVLPIKLVKEKQEEVKIITGMNVVEELKLKAINLAYDKMKSSLKDSEYIMNYRVLNSKIIAQGIEMQIFFSVYEDITAYQPIAELKEVE